MGKGPQVGADDGFGNNLVWLSVLVQRHYAQICADHDLTPAQATLLCMIKDRPLGMGELALQLGLAKNALSGLVERTERRGLVRRETLQPDRRAVTLSTTALGQKVVEALYTDVSDRMPEIVATLPAAEQEQLAEMVAHITSTALTDCTTGPCARPPRPFDA